MNKIILFLILSIPVIIISRKNLFKPKSHGFYRFFGWECILWLFANNYKYWFLNPFSLQQLVAWVLLIISAYIVIAGVHRLKKHGKSENRRDDKELYQFEKTSELVDKGIYKYIRHPLYSSLLFLTWGIFLKNTNIQLFVVAVFSSLFLFLTARADEKECINFFGDDYVSYMKRTKRFIPFIF